MTAVYVMLGILIAVMLGVIFALVIYVRRNKDGDEAVDSVDFADDLKKEMATTIKIENSMLTGAVTAQTEHTKDMTARIDGYMQEMYRKIDELKAENTKNLLAMKEDNQRQLELVRKDNEKQLEKMRETVDEKLSANLEQRFNQSFKLVGERLAEINNTFNALQGLQHDVNDLNKIFKNVKTRGTWGEVALDNLLSQILTADQYESQAKVKRGSENRVDFAIKLPGTGDGTVLLPIDCKFPMEEYERLVDASVEGDSAAVEAHAKMLADAVMTQGRSIRDKYINPPATTDFAVMYLPVEGLYAEVVRRSELLAKLQNECKVVVAGPTTLTALLNSLRMGFRSVAIEKKSKEISTLLVRFQKDFDTFSKYLAKLKSNMDTVQKTIDSAQSKSDQIGAKLAKVTKIDVEETDVNLLESFENTDEIIDAAADFATEE